MLPLLQLGSSASAYLDGLKDKRVNYISHIRRINDDVATFGTDAVARALADAHANNAYSADHIHNLLSARHRSKNLADAGPLHVTRNADLLNIELPTADLKIYDQDTSS